MTELLLKRVYGEDNKFQYEELVTEFVPPDTNGPAPIEDLIYFTPVFELGASSEDPTLGDGSIVGWYTKNVYSNGTRIDLELYIENEGGSKGVGTGSYEVYLPDELEPALDYYMGPANLYVAGGGVSEFDGSVKWTKRNEQKGPKLIFTFNGGEWRPSDPKPWNDFKLRANIRYWL